MTASKKLKREVRERMKITGETYCQALEKIRAEKGIKPAPKPEEPKA